jgi:hypothetical protein
MTTRKGLNYLLPSQVLRSLAMTSERAKVYSLESGVHDMGTRWGNLYLN